MTKSDMPDGCVCDPEDWDYDPPEVCRCFVGDDIGAHCEACLHDYKCHDEAAR